MTRIFFGKRDSSTHSIPKQLSKKLKIFTDLFTAFLKSTFNFEHCEEKDEPHSLCICESVVDKRSGYVNVLRVTFQYNRGQSTC